MSHERRTNSPVAELSRSLLRLHKALLDDERRAYERVHGRIASNGAFLQLVLGDPWFAWLRPLSQLMVTLDELDESAEPTAPAEITALLASARTLLTPSEEGEGFARQYYEALQRSPDVGLAHAEVRARLAQSASGKESIR
ncbi:MAG: conserved protein of unknown function [Nitrospira sp.]